MRKLVKFLLIADALLLFSTELFTPIYAIFVESIQGTILDVGVAWAIAAFVYATLMYPFGRLADRYSRKKFVVLQFFGSAFVFAYLTTIESVVQLYIAEFMLGFFMAVGTPAHDGLFSRNLDKGKECEEWGLWDMIEGYATAFSAIVGASLVYFMGFEYLFIMMSGMAFISGFIVVFFVEERHIAKKRYKIKRRVRRKKR